MTVLWGKREMNFVWPNMVPMLSPIIVVGSLMHLRCCVLWFKLLNSTKNIYMKTYQEEQWRSDWMRNSRVVEVEWLLSSDICKISKLFSSGCFKDPYIILCAFQGEDGTSCACQVTESKRHQNKVTWDWSPAPLCSSLNIIFFICYWEL